MKTNETDVRDRSESEESLHLRLPVIRGDRNAEIEIEAISEGIEVGAGFIIPWEFIHASEKLLVARGLLPSLSKVNTTPQGR